MNSEIRVIVFRDGSLFVAQGIELDIAAQGATPEQAMENLGVVLRAEMRDAAADSRDVRDIGPAPAPFHAMCEDQIVAREHLMVA